LSLSKTKNSNTQKLRAIVIFGVMLTAIQQYPIIASKFYNEARILIYLIFVFLSVIGVKRLIAMEVPPLIRQFFVAVTIIAIELLFFRLLGSKVLFTEILEFLIPLGLLVFSFSVPMSEKLLEFFLVIYSLSISVLGVLLFLLYGPGFAIVEQFFYGSKNQVGPLLSIAIVIVLHKLVFRKQNSGSRKIFAILLSVILMSAIVALFILRNRSGILGISIITTLMILVAFLQKRSLLRVIWVVLICFLTIVLFIAGSLDPFFELMNNVFFLGTVSTDLDSVSSGRWNVYVRSLTFVSRNPLFGELFSEDGIPETAHNYVLNKWVKYGLIGSMPQVFMYLYLCVFLAKEFLRKVQNRSKLALWLLLLGLLISLFEFSYPYGPGTSQIMVWFLIGQYLAMWKGHTYSEYNNPQERIKIR